MIVEPDAAIIVAGNRAAGSRGGRYLCDAFLMVLRYF
jgi:hypothetical protein